MTRTAIERAITDIQSQARRAAARVDDAPFAPVYKGTYAIRHLRESDDVFSRFYRYLARHAREDWLTAKRRFITDTGVPVRSKGEQAIANALTRLGITYHYEPLLDFGTYFRTPDFYLPAYDLIIEHAGPSDEKYQESFARKKALYARHKVRWIVTTPDDLKDPVAALRKKLAAYATPQDL